MIIWFYRFPFHIFVVVYRAFHALHFEEYALLLQFQLGWYKMPIFWKCKFVQLIPILFILWSSLSFWIYPHFWFCSLFRLIGVQLDNGHQTCKFWTVVWKLSKMKHTNNSEPNINIVETMVDKNNRKANYKWNWRVNCD